MPVLIGAFGLTPIPQLMETNAFPSLKMTENAAFPIIYRYAAHCQSRPINPTGLAPVVNEVE
jgi:hypothetical protein